MRPLPYFSLAALATASLVFGVPAVENGAQAEPDHGRAQLADVPTGSPQPQISYGARIAANDFYDAYYDGSYGTFTDVYFGQDGHYWYLSQDGRIWARDDGGHFRRTPAEGFALVRGTGVQREN
jgi:hypothetical protein